MTLPPWLPLEIWKQQWLCGLTFGFLFLLVSEPVTLPVTRSVKLIAVATIPIIPLVGLAVLWAKSLAADANGSSKGD